MAQSVERRIGSAEVTATDSRQQLEKVRFSELFYFSESELFMLMRIVLKQWLTDSDSCDKVYNVAKRFQQITSQAAVAQSVERRIGSAEVTGPIPVSSFFVV